MIKVILSSISYENDNELKKETIDSKELSKPKNYEEFISNIIKSFKIKNKENTISLMVFTIGGDEIPIKDQKDFESYNDEASEYRVNLTKKNEDPFDEIDINIDLKLEIADLEIENLIDGIIKDIPEIDNNIINDDIQFDIEEYKEELNSKNNKIIKKFNNSFDIKIKNMFDKNNIMKEKINNSILNFTNNSIKYLKKINDEIKEIKEDFGEIAENYDELNKALKLLDFPKKEKPTIRFLKENIDLEIEKKEAKFLEISNIIIENFGFKSYRKLCFVKDENRSSKDINFYGNSKNLNLHKLSLNGPFSPNNREMHSFILQIKNPIPSQIYTLYIYTKEKEGGSILSSKELKINVKIKEEEKEDPKKILEENAKKLLTELEKKYNLTILCTNKELLKKFIELDNNMESINKWIENELSKKADELYKELNMKDICNEKEGKSKIFELKFDKGEIIKWINDELSKIPKNLKIEIEIEKLYEELDTAFSISDKIDKNEVLNIIKDKNLDKNSIINWIKYHKIVDETVDFFDKEYNILAILEDEDEFRQKIIELKFDENKIREWIEIKLSS